MESLEKYEFSVNNSEYNCAEDEASLIGSVKEILNSIPNNYLVDQLNALFNKEFNNIKKDNNDVNKKDSLYNKYNDNDSDINSINDISFDFKYQEKNHEIKSIKPIKNNKLTNKKNKDNKTNKNEINKKEIINKNTNESLQKENTFCEDEILSKNKRKEKINGQKNETQCCFII